MIAVDLEGCRNGEMCVRDESKMDDEDDEDEVMMERESDWDLGLCCCGAGQCSGRLRRNKQRRMRFFKFFRIKADWIDESSRSKSVK